MFSKFFSLPREIRDQIYELVLLHREPIDPWLDGNRRQNLNSQLLRASKAVHHETSLLFYAQNIFDFTYGTPEDVVSFLGQIGRNNADHIRHICVDFPMFLYLLPGDVVPEDDGIAILANIQSGCASLSTLTMSLPSTSSMERRLHLLDDPEIVSEALQLVNTHCRAITSLQKIVVEVYENNPSDDIRRKFESHGWTISIHRTEYLDTYMSLSDFEYDNYGFYDDYENDSDFWKGDILERGEDK